MEKITLERIIEQAKNDRSISLNLSSRGILDLPESIGSCKSLMYLSLENNYLTTFPDIICDLTELNYLNIGDNNITYLPESIINLSKLNGLYLKGNQIKDFSILRELPRLQYVHFGQGYFHRKYWSSFDEWHPQYLLDQKEEEMRLIRINSERDCYSEC